MNNPKLSIITINFNNSAGLRKTVEGVLNQSFSDFEYIVIDGGSTDGSVEIIKEFENRISFWISEPDKGIYNAMNKGILKSKGSFLQFLNSGDYFFNELILEEIFINKFDRDIVYTEGFATNLRGVVTRTRIPDNLSLLHLIEHSLCHPGTFISKKTFDKIGLYNENYRICSDTEFFIKAYIGGIQFQKINLATVVMEPEGISQTSLEILKDEQLKMVVSNTDENYYKLFLERMSLLDQLTFLKKSRFLRFLLKHRENHSVNKLLSLF